MYLTISDLLALVPVSKSSIYRAMREDNFPAPLKIGGRSCWSRDLVEAWLAGKDPNFGITTFDMQRYAFLEGFEDARSSIEHLAERGVPSDQWVTLLKEHEDTQLRPWSTGSFGARTFSADDAPILEVKA